MTPRVDFNSEIHQRAGRVRPVESGQPVQRHHAQGNGKLRVAGKYLPAVDEQPESRERSGGEGGRSGASWRRGLCGGGRCAWRRSRGGDGCFERPFRPIRRGSGRGGRHRGTGYRRRRERDLRPVRCRPGGFGGRRNRNRPRWRFLAGVFCRDVSSRRNSWSW